MKISKKRESYIIALAERVAIDLIEYHIDLKIEQKSKSIYKILESSSKRALMMNSRKEVTDMENELITKKIIEYWSNYIASEEKKEKIPYYQQLCEKETKFSFFKKETPLEEMKDFFDEKKDLHQEIFDSLIVIGNIQALQYMMKSHKILPRPEHAIQTIKIGQPEVFDLLIGNGVQLNYRIDYFFTIAIYYENEDMQYHLFKKGIEKPLNKPSEEYIIALKKMECRQMKEGLEGKLEEKPINKKNKL